MIDASMIATAGAVVTAAVCAVGWHKAHARAGFAEEYCQTLANHCRTQASKIARLEAAEAERVAHCRAIAAKGNAASQEARRKARKEAQAKTLDAVQQSNFRPRTKVVAPVKAKRTRQRKAAASPAA